jgi:hypothetical protein
VTVQYGSPEFFPQIVALHTCPCGRVECEHGRHVDELPPGWERFVLAEGEVEICPTCAASGHGPSSSRTC